MSEKCNHSFIETVSGTRCYKCDTPLIICYKLRGTEIERLNAERRRDAIDGQAAIDEANNAIILLRRERDAIRTKLDSSESIRKAEKQILIEEIEKNKMLRTKLKELKAWRKKWKYAGLNKLIGFDEIMNE